MILEETNFDEIVDFHNNRRIPLSSLERDTRQGQYPYYGAQGVIDHIDGYIFDGEYVLIAEDGANLVTRNQPVAQIARGQFWVNNHAHIVTAKSGISSNYFIHTLINNMDLRGYVTGAAQPKLNMKNLKAVKVSVPSFAHQKRIASILSAYDDLIENNRRRIALLEEAARLLYREWFVHFRFPGHEHVKIVDGMPEGWEQLSLEELLVLQRGFDLPVASRKDGNVPVYGSTGIVGYHDVAKVEAPMLITGRSGSLGKVAFVSTPCWPLNTALWVKEFRRISPWFGYFLLSELGLEKFNGGASVPTLDRKVVHRLLVARPIDQLLNAFDDQVKPSFEMIDKLNYQNHQLSEARDLLLPRLMDGRLVV